MFNIFLSFFIFLLLVQPAETYTGPPRFLYQINDIKFEAVTTLAIPNSSTIFLKDVNSDQIYFRFEVLDVGDILEGLDVEGNLLIDIWRHEKPGPDEFVFSSVDTVRIPNVGGPTGGDGWYPAGGSFPWIPKTWVWEGNITLPGLPADIFSKFAVLGSAGRSSPSFCGFHLLIVVSPNVTAKIDKTNTKVLTSLNPTNEMWEKCWFPIFEKFVVNSTGKSLQGKNIFYFYKFSSFSLQHGIYADQTSSSEKKIHPGKIEGIEKLYIAGHDSMKPGINEINFEIFFKSPYLGISSTIPRTLLDSLSWKMNVSYNATFNFRKEEIAGKNRKTVFSGEYFFNNVPMAGKLIQINLDGSQDRVLYTRVNKDGKFSCNYPWGTSIVDICQSVGGRFPLSPGIYRIHAKIMTEPEWSYCRSSNSLLFIVPPVIEVNFNPKSVFPGGRAEAKIKIIGGGAGKNINVYKLASPSGLACSCITTLIDAFTNDGECKCSFDAPSSEGTFYYWVDAGDLDEDERVSTYEGLYAPLIVATNTCSDGIPYGQCSSTKPKYCDNGNLIDKCSQCGCFYGQICNVTSETCYVPVPTQVSLQPGWNMFSLPSTTTTDAVKSQCGTANNIWHYNPSTSKYEAVSTIEPGKGYWLKLSSPCAISSSISASVYPELKVGWNQIGALSTVSFNSIKGSCNVLNGPWKYNPSTLRYELSSILEPVYGYWIKVSNDCTLG